MPKQLVRGLPQLSKGARYHRSGKWAVKQRGPQKAEKKVVGLKVKKYGKNETRVIYPKGAKFYPTEEVPRPLHHRNGSRPAKLRASLVPGTVLIVLAGRFRGKRVVYLRPLPSGTLLITGPFKLNGVPLRRVNPRYVIATSTKIDVSKVKIPEKVGDAYFKKEKKDKKKKSQEEFFNKEKKEKKDLPAEVIEIQKSVDEQLLPLVRKEAHLEQYLSQVFTLRDRQYPHEMKF